MNFIKYSLFLVFVAFASGKELIDPWRREREHCRKKMGLTKEQLASSRNNLRSLKYYFTCLATELGHLRENGTVDVDLEIKHIELQIPVVIAAPIIRCCNDQVYQGRVPPKHEIADYFIGVIQCFEQFFSPEIFNIIGALEPPVYPRLEHCHKSHEGLGSV